MHNPILNTVYLFALCMGLAFSSASSSADDESCVTCHGDVTDKWAGSHHGKAMAEPSTESVLGDFSGTSISHHGQTAKFSKQGDSFQVDMTDEGHAPQSYTVAYVFGITPLQQYLVETEEGRYQVLPFAWDSRDKQEGGQRWFHIYPDETLPPGDRLHWQQPLQNWNGMCADCHSTGLKRNYDSASDTFKTTFDSVNVSCSSCHAGAAGHAEGRMSGHEDKGDWVDPIVSYLNDSEGFVREDGMPTAQYTGSAPRKRPEMQVCAACHSRRAPLSDGIDPAVGFLDQFTPSLLDDGLYFADGQIQDEVYVWGSFQQSKMFEAGVSCFDCHDSHSLKLKAEGNNLCTSCHAPEVFDDESHTKHPEESSGAECVSCHMPERTYMVVDPRRDHSFKVPRPDLSRLTGSPNACVTCHEDKNNTWAADTLKEWYPDSKQRDRSAVAIHGARRGHPSARAGLLSIINDESKPAIARASALELVPRVGDSQLLDAARKSLAHEEPLIRIGAIRAMAVLPPEQRLELLKPLLEDSVKAVRTEAARQLLDAPEARTFEKAFAELKGADLQAAWRGEGRMNMAMGHEFTGEASEAEREYRASLKIDPAFAPGLINLTELLRRTGREQEGLALLKKAVSEGSNIDPALHHAYGLALVRKGDGAASLVELKKAMTAARDNARYTYVYLVALNSQGQAEDVYRGLKSALRRHRYDPDLLNFALSLALNKRDSVFARQIVRSLLSLDPANQELLGLQQQLSR